MHKVIQSRMVHFYRKVTIYQMHILIAKDKV